MSASIAGTHIFADNQNMLRPMAAPAPNGSLVGFQMRPPNPGPAPQLNGVTGLGNGPGGGAGVFGDSAYGQIMLYVGLNAATSGTLSLFWPVLPPAGANGITFAAEFAALTVSGAPNGYIISWGPLPVPPRQSSRPMMIHYRWTNAN